jgi:hypothetical protein
LGDLPDNELPSNGANEVARQVLEKSPTKKVAPSKPHPLADEEDDDDMQNIKSVMAVPVASLRRRLDPLCPSTLLHLEIQKSMPTQTKCCSLLTAYLP